MKKILVLLAVVLALSMYLLPKVQTVQAAGICDYQGGGSMVGPFTTPKVLPDAVNTWAVSTWFHVEVTYFTPGSPGVWAYLYYANGTLYDKVLLTSDRPGFTWGNQFWDCMYVKLVSGSSWSQASGNFWIYY